MRISVVSPVFQAEEIVEELVSRIDEQLSKLSTTYEILLIDDGSADSSWSEIERISTFYDHLVGVKLSRNFGQHYAITAGIREATGDVVILMDCDLQDDPIFFPDLIAEYQKGYDIVYAYRRARKHGLWKNVTARLFNMLFNSLVSGNRFKSSENIGTFSLLSRKAVDAFVQVNDYHRHYLTILRWIGFSSTTVEVEHMERFQGQSSYSFSKLLAHAIDGITSQSDRLLSYTVLIGFAMSLLAFSSAVFIVIQALIKPFKPGWASTAVLILLVGGLTITAIGIVGIYVGKVFDQSKSRPLYLIEKRVGKSLR